jgi:hypothetical protein
MEQKDLFTDDVDKTLLTAFSWWEKRRLFYNLVIGLVGVIILFIYPFFSLLDLAGVIFYGIIANLFYSLGFFIEVAAKYYFKSDIDFTDKRKTLFTLGLIFSVLTTIAVGFFFMMILIPHQS